MEKQLVLFGTSEAAELAHFYYTHDSPYTVAAFTVDRDYLKEETFCGLPVVPFETIRITHPPRTYCMAVTTWFGGVNRTRREKYLEAKKKGYEMVTYISSKAITWPGLAIGENCFIYETVHIQPFVRIGNNVTICGGSVIAHHVEIGDNCFLAPDTILLGCAVIEQNCFLGANCTIRNNITVGSETIVGAGALVLEDTPSSSVYKGTPALLLPRRSTQINIALK